MNESGGAHMKLPSLRRREIHNSRSTRGCAGCGHRKRDHDLRKAMPGLACLMCNCGSYRMLSRVRPKA